MPYSTIKYGETGGIAHIILNRPRVSNCVNLDMVGDLKEVCNSLNQDEGIRAVIVSGTGDHFCSGEDLVEISREDLAKNCNVAETLANVEVPVIAAINGDALGVGLALALACDIRIASEESSFGVARTGEEYVMPIGTTQLLPRIVGRAKALEMLLVGELVQAEEAYRIGLVHRIVPRQEVETEAQRIADSIVAKGPIANKYAKETICKGLDLTLEQGLRLECDVYMILHTTKDRTEGITAFLQKKPPEFKSE